MDAQQGQPEKPNGHGRHGGRRVGGGRPKGSNAGTSRGNKVMNLRQRFPKMPIEHMLGVLNEPDIQVPEALAASVNSKNKEEATAAQAEISEIKEDILRQIARKDDMAKSAAPYIHPRLSSLQVRDERRADKSAFDLSKLSNEELVLFELLAAKMQFQQMPTELLEGDDPDVGMRVISYDAARHEDVSE